MDDSYKEQNDGDFGVVLANLHTIGEDGMFRGFF